MLRKTIIVLMGVATFVMLGSLNVGITGCGGGGTTADVSRTIKTATCSDYPAAFETTINLEAVKGLAPDNEDSNAMMAMIPDDLDVCFNNLGELTGDDSGIGLGWVLEIPAIAGIIPTGIDTDLKIFELAVSPKEAEVSEDVGLDNAIQNIEMKFSNALVADMFGILEPFVDNAEDRAEMAEVEVLVDTIAKEYFAGFDCTVESSCAEMNDTESGFTLNCTTADLDLYEVLDALPAEQLALILGDSQTKADLLSSLIGEDGKHISIPASTFEFELKPVESCSIIAMVADQIEISSGGGDDNNDNDNDNDGGDDVVADLSGLASLSGNLYVQPVDANVNKWADDPEADLGSELYNGLYVHYDSGTNAINVYTSASQATPLLLDVVDENGDFESEPPYYYPVELEHGGGVIAWTSVDPLPTTPFVYELIGSADYYCTMRVPASNSVQLICNNGIVEHYKNFILAE